MAHRRKYYSGTFYVVMALLPTSCTRKFVARETHRDPLDPACARIHSTKCCNGDSLYIPRRRTEKHANSIGMLYLSACDHMTVVALKLNLQHQLRLHTGLLLTVARCDTACIFYHSQSIIVDEINSLVTGILFYCIQSFCFERLH